MYFTSTPEFGNLLHLKNHFNQYPKILNTLWAAKTLRQSKNLKRSSFLPLSRKRSSFIPTKRLNLRIKESPVTDRTTPVARSECTIYGQIFKTKAVRSNPIRPIHVNVWVKMKLRLSTVCCILVLHFMLLWLLGEKLTQLKSGVRGKLDSQKWVRGTRKFRKPCFISFNIMYIFCPFFLLL